MNVAGDPMSVRRNLAHQRGFTLIELMVVITIMGILAMLAVPRVLSASNKAKVSEALTTLATYERAQQTYLTESMDVGVVGDLILDDPTIAGFSQYFEFADLINAGADATLTGTLQNGIAPLVGKDIWVEVQIDGSSARDCEDVYLPYAPNWRD